MEETEEGEGMGTEASFASSRLVEEEEQEGMVTAQVFEPPSSYSDSRIVPEYNEADYQSHRNVYVAVHMPHSRSRHRHHHHHHHHNRHKRRHNRHGNGHGRHGNGHDDHGNEHDHRDSELLQDDVAVDSPDLGISFTVPSNEHSPPPPTEVSSAPDMNRRFSKSHSLPTGYLRSQQHHKSSSAIEPTTPADPCDRVKFILGSEYDQDQTDHHHDCNTTHSIFTELEELKFDQHEQRMEWKETARWIKFEEDVEEGGNKWSKPHVATLSLHSLFDLRSCIFKGTVLLDLQADNLATISDIVLDNLVHTGQLEEECRDKVRSALLQKHHHLNSKKDHGEKKILEHIRSFGEMARQHSKDFDTGSLSLGGGGGNGSLFGSRSNSRRGSLMDGNGVRNGMMGGNGSIRLEEDACTMEHEATLPRKHDSFMKKLPPGSEASNVLVGEVDFLTHPIIAFVRLARGQYLGDITEVPIPTRFIFIMLGPTGYQERYHEIGRSISTLMSDEVFHEVAYKARNRGDLMAGIDEFLDKVTILPPGEWDPQIRLEPPSKIPSQANRKTTLDQTKLSVDTGRTEPFKCKHCKHSIDGPSPVKWNKRPFQGLVKDALQCYSMYRGDFGGAFNLQSIAALILIYFANITLAFTFGAVLSDQTESTLGATETILAVGISNFFYSIFSGQPLVILGPTGPTIIFEQLIFAFCNMQGIPFLEFRFWIGLWTAIFMFVLVAFNTSAVTRLFTRFTEEIFTVLIGLVFVSQAFIALWNIHSTHPYNKWLLYPTIRRNCDCYEFPSVDSCRDGNMSNATFLHSFWDDDSTRNCSMSCFRPLRSSHRRFVGSDCPKDEFGMLTEYHDVFLMSVILFFGTFLFCIYFKKLRNTKFFKSYIRQVLSDFAVFIAVVVWVVVDILAQVDTPKLVVPNIFESGVYSHPNRTFLINPLGNDLPSWAPGAALVPALLATILFFMDQHITAIIVNRKDNKLKKHPGYHLDLFLIGCLIFLHAMLGLPWVVGATILSISHVQSLFIYSSHTAPGETPKFIGVREQRVTLFLMAILVGISVMAYSVLELLPLPVLYGLVLYLGVASLYGVQFCQRIKLFFIPAKHRPDHEYLRHIPNWRIYTYTGIQIAFLVLLSIFQFNFYLRAIFPIMVATLVIGRWLLGFVFSKHDLELLDDPIPDALYCKPCKNKTHHQQFDPEACSSSAETLQSLTHNNSSHTHHHQQISSTPQQDMVALTSEPTTTSSISSSRNGSVPKDGFNFTHEMDQCDLWKNMVKNYDAPLPSPRVAKAHQHHHHHHHHYPHPLHPGLAVDTELDTLEECDTDLETQTPLCDSDKHMTGASLSAVNTTKSLGRGTASSGSAAAGGVPNPLILTTAV